MLFESLVARPLFALTKSDPERAHHFMMRAMSITNHVPPVLGALEMIKADEESLHQSLLGTSFKGVVGLGAGFDKQAQGTATLTRIFDFVEIGTVLNGPQKGNDRPRIVRIAGDEGLINRMGFNSDGIDVVEQRLDKYHGLSAPVFANISKLKPTPLEDAAEEYVQLTTRLRDKVAALVVNVSSPNTPGLRLMQSPEYLNPLASAVMQAAGTTPVLFKFDPDIDDGALKECFDVVAGANAAGVVLGNTSMRRPGAAALLDEAGGYSGPYLYDRMLEMVRLASTSLPSGRVIIGCGGINSVDRAWGALNEGASLLEIYSAFIYRGPGIVRKINKGVAARLRKRGLTSINDLR